MKSRKAKVSLVRSNITIKTLRKNREKYDIQKIKREAMSTYTPFDEDRFNEIVRKAHQRQSLGDNIKVKPDILISNQSLLRVMPMHKVPQHVQIRMIEMIINRMIVVVKRLAYK